MSLGVELLVSSSTVELNTVQEKALAAIVNAREHVLRLVDDLLTYSRIEANADNMVLSSVAVGPLVEQSNDLVAQQASSAGLALERRGCTDISIRADRDRMLQVMINLLANAIDTPTRAVR